MKKIIIVLGLVSLSSCNKDVPKCDDKEVIETVFSILAENSRDLFDEYGRHSVTPPNNENAKMESIMTVREDEKLNSCGCQGTLTIAGPLGKEKGVVDYDAQKNSDGEIVVKVENAGPFNLKLE